MFIHVRYIEVKYTSCNTKCIIRINNDTVTELCPLSNHKNIFCNLFHLLLPKLWSVLTGIYNKVVCSHYWLVSTRKLSIQAIWLAYTTKLPVPPFYLIIMFLQCCDTSLQTAFQVLLRHTKIFLSCHYYSLLLVHPV